LNQHIILTGLCFWSTEAIFQRIKGVTETKCGYYNIEHFEFAWEEGDHLESVLITYDDKEISLESLLNIYFLTHNPALISWDITECIYPLCRPAIFHFKDSDAEIINKIHNEYKEASTEDFHTKVLPGDLTLFKKALEYDQNFYNKRPEDGFSCSNIVPKIEKVQLKFPHLLK